MDAPQPGPHRRKATRESFFHLPSAGLALIVIARRIHPSLSLVDREVECVVVYPRHNRCPLLVGYDVRAIPVRMTAPRFELTSLRQKV